MINFVDIMVYLINGDTGTGTGWLGSIVWLQSEHDVILV